MAVEKIHFIAGLPRSGSTLLVNILRQNPRFYASSSSPILEMIGSVRNNWHNHAFTRAMHRSNVNVDDVLVKIMRGMMREYASALSDRPVFFDKMRGWTLYPEMAAACAGVEPENIRMLICVRNLFEVLASMERKHRASADTRNTMVKLVNGQTQPCVTVIDRVTDMLGSDGVVGNPVLCMKEMYARGYGKQMFILDAEKFTESPKRYMRDVHDFLGEPDFAGYNFEKIEQTEKEDDFVFGFKDLHELRDTKVDPKILAKSHDKTFIGEIVDSPLWAQIKTQQEFWKEWKTANK